MMRFDNITVSVVLKYGTTDTEENALCYIPRRYNTLQREREESRQKNLFYNKRKSKLHQMIYSFLVIITLLVCRVVVLVGVLSFCVLSLYIPSFIQVSSVYEIVKLLFLICWRGYQALIQRCSSFNKISAIGCKIFTVLIK